MPDERIAEIAYEAYRKSSGGKSLISGAPIPEFAALPEAIKVAWKAAADAVVYHVLVEGKSDG